MLGLPKRVTYQDPCSSAISRSTRWLSRMWAHSQVPSQLWSARSARQLIPGMNGSHTDEQLGSGYTTLPDRLARLLLIVIHFRCINMPGRSVSPNGLTTSRMGTTHLYPIRRASMSEGCVTAATFSSFPNPNARPKPASGIS